MVEKNWHRGEPTPEGGITAEFARLIQEEDKRLVAAVRALALALVRAEPSKGLHESCARSALMGVTVALLDYSHGKSEIEDVLNRAMNGILFAMGQAYGHGVFDGKPLPPGNA